MEESNMREFQSGDKTLKLTARQRAIRDYLEKKLPGSGSIYLGVLFALSDSRNAESIVQAAHSCRELIIKLRPEIPDVAGEAAQGEAYLKVGELSSFYEANPTDRELRDKVEELDRWYKQTQVTRRQKHEEFIEQASESGQPNEKDKKRAARELRDYKDWLSKIAHHGAENVTESDFRKRLQGFEQILEPLIGDYYPVEAEVQKLMMKSDPDESDMRKLRNLFLKPAAASFFFHNAQNCRWLPLLKAEGYFTSPTDIITHEDGTISCPAWPQSSMLSRCVESYPELVSDIIINVEETSNAQVHQELVEIALKLPISLVIEFANKSKEWIRDRYHISPLLPIRLAQLAAKLASAGEEGAGLDMVDTLLDVTIDEEKYRKQTETIGLSLAPQAEAYADDWHYGELLQTLETSTDLRRSKEYVRRLCYKLSKAIRIEHKIRGDDKAETDSTHFARPAIENHEQNSGTDRLKDHLITHIRDRLVELVREGVAVDEIICLLHEFKYPVFRRLEIHLLTEFPDQSRKHIEVLLGNKANFENARVHHELHRLLEKAFGHVSSDIRQGYLDWITAGPDIQQYKDMVRSQTGKEPTQDEARAYVARWKHRKYNPIKAYLNEQHSVELKKLQAEYNTEEHPEFLYYRTSWAGPTSPVDDKELGNRSVLEVLAYLTEWEPPKGHFEPSPEGLGRFFKDDVGNRALEYSQIADRIEPKQLRPVYLYYLFIGFRKSLKDHKEIDGSRVLKLAERIVFAEHLPEPDKSQDDFETGWRGVRKEIGSLISEGLTSADAIPFNMRERIWQLVERLCGDEDPTIEFEAEYGGSNMSPVDMSINTVRGEA
ncbi:MAG: hypothetical protein OEW00_12965, partial [candidate division Zixibacteria bacterium]|nr:hypothetical protein [candidate division Zixibacteria bacterium]